MKEGGIFLPWQILSLSLLPHLLKGLLKAGLEDTEPGAWDWAWTIDARNRWWLLSPSIPLPGSESKVAAWTMSVTWGAKPEAGLGAGVILVLQLTPRRRQ